MAGKHAGLFVLSSTILLTAAMMSSADAPGSVPVVPYSIGNNGGTVSNPNLLIPMLQAGDADENLEFDQYDLVQVLQAGKYLTGQAATWAEGDWNGAPGGIPGSPPPGDGQFNQLDIMAALNTGLYLAGPYASGGIPAPLPPPILPGGVFGDEQTSLVYDPITGEVSIAPPFSGALTSLNVVSTSGIFTGDPPQNLDGLFDNATDVNLFKMTFRGLGSLSFGNVASAGLSEASVVADLRVNGSLQGGGGLGDVDLVYFAYIPPTPLPEDINEDGRVGRLDLIRLQHQWQQGWRD